MASRAEREAMESCRLQKLEGAAALGVQMGCCCFHWVMWGEATVANVGLAFSVGERGAWKWNFSASTNSPVVRR